MLQKGKEVKTERHQKRRKEVRADKSLQSESMLREINCQKKYKEEKK
jgi:hypothetical protein